MTHILVVTTNLAPAGGSADAAAGNAWRLVFEALGRHVTGTVLAPHVAGAPRRESLGGLNVRRVRPARPVASLEDSLVGLRAIRVGAMSASLWASARAELASRRYDVAHGLWAFPAGLALTHPRPTVAVLLSCPGSDLHAWADTGIAGRLIRRTLRRAHTVATTSLDGAEHALRAGAHAAVAVPICFDPGVFGLSERLPSAPVIAYTGRMTRSKGIFVLAEALGRLASVVPDLRFVACGSGPDAAAFERAVRTVLGDRASFLGAVPPGDVARIVASSRVAVLPSFGEGLPAAALETLACGRPMVATDTGEHARLLRAGGGRVVPPGDAAALADALGAELAIRRDPASLRALVAGYTPESIAGMYLGLYEQLASSATSTRQGLQRPKPGWEVAA